MSNLRGTDQGPRADWPFFMCDDFLSLAPELDVPVAAGGDCEVGVSCDGGEGDDVAVHEALLVVVRVRQVGQVQLLEFQDLKGYFDWMYSNFVTSHLI